MSGQRALRVAAGLGVLLFLAGCAGKPPEISRAFARVLYSYDTATRKTSESLGVFLVATDPDGLENLSAFYAINDEAELYWKVDRTEWITTSAEGETWIGTTSLSMPDASPFPAGTWRIVLQDTGGETVEQTVTIPDRTVRADKAVYPTAGVHAGSIGAGRVSGAYDVWVYSREGKFLASYGVSGASHALAVQTVTAALPALAGGFTYRIFAWDEKAGYGVVSGPYSTGALSGR